jgi:hypothetical protein
MGIDYETMPGERAVLPWFTGRSLMESWGRHRERNKTNKPHVTSKCRRSPLLKLVLTMNRNDVESEQLTAAFMSIKGIGDVQIKRRHELENLIFTELFRICMMEMFGERIDQCQGLVVILLAERL